MRLLLWGAAAGALAGCPGPSGPSTCDDLSTAVSDLGRCATLCAPLLADAGLTQPAVCVGNAETTCAIGCLSGTTCDQDLSAYPSGLPVACSATDQTVLGAKTECLQAFTNRFQQTGHASTVSGGNLGFACDVTPSQYQSDTAALLGCLADAGALSSGCNSALTTATQGCGTST